MSVSIFDSFLTTSDMIAVFDDQAAALEELQAALADEADPDRKDLIRRTMVGLFTELGPDHPLAREHRRRLSAALN